MTTQASIASPAAVPPIPAVSASRDLTAQVMMPVASASQLAAGSTPIALTITLNPPPPVTVPLYENVAVWIAAATLLGVCITLIAAARRTKQELAASTARMRIELDHAAAQATIEREQTREQAALDRQHDADEAHGERIITARRTVYIETIGELVKAQTFLGGLAKQDLTNLDISTGLGGLLTAVARISILGEMATVAKSRAVVSLINQALFKGLATVMPLGKLKSSITFHDKQYAATQFETERILAEMNNYNETLKNDKPGFDALQRSFDNQQAAAKLHSADSVKAKLALADGEKEYGIAVMEDMKIVANRLDELACAIREELGLETSLEEFRRMTATMQKEAAAAMHELFIKVDAFRKEAGYDASTTSRQ
jgi:hypothetical protein